MAPIRYKSWYDRAESSLRYSSKSITIRDPPSAGPLLLVFSLLGELELFGIDCLAVFKIHTFVLEFAECSFLSNDAGKKSPAKDCKKKVCQDDGCSFIRCFFEAVHDKNRTRLARVLFLFYMLFSRMVWRSFRSSMLIPITMSSMVSVFS